MKDSPSKKVFRRSDSKSLKRDKELLMSMMRFRQECVRDGLPRTARAIGETISVLKRIVETFDYQETDALLEHLSA